MPTPQLPRSHRTALALALALASACGEAPPAGPTEWKSLVGPAPEPEGLVHEDFLVRHAFADHWGETRSLQVSLIANRKHLTAGWSYPNHSDDAGTEEIAAIWTDSEHAEVTFVIAEVGARSLQVRLQPFRAIREKGSMEVRVSLNDEEIDVVEIQPKGKLLELELPAEHQRVGLNVLALDLSDCWRIKDHVEGSGDIRRVGVNANAFLFEIEDDEVRRRHGEGRNLFPAGIEIREDGQGEKALFQRAGHVLRHNVRVPPGATLVTGVGFAARTTGGPERAALRVHLTDESGARAIVIDEVAEFGAAYSGAEAALDRWQGQVVQLDFDVRAADGSNEPVVGVWKGPTLSAPPIDVAEEPRALTAARGKLAGAPVVLLLLDACNPSFVSSYGGRDGLSPTLDRLAAEGAQFDQAYTLATYTISSVPSVLTSTFTWEHGAWLETTKLAESIPTWPEAFRSAGYRTVGFSCSTNGSSVFGFDRGFEEFHDTYKDVVEGRETVIAEQLLEPIAKVLDAESEEPLFLWLHIVEPHEPYVPPPSWAGRFSKDLPGELSGDSETLWRIRQWEIDPTEEDLTRIKAQYEENLGYVDEVLGRLRTMLAEKGVLEEAIIVVFSDHGEGFLDHRGTIYQGMGHGSTVYDDQAKIPLIVRLPQGIAPAGLQVSGLTSNMDILPTVADLVGVPPPSGSLRGSSFAARLFEPGAATRTDVVSHTYNLMHKRRFLPGLSIREGKWKYIHVSGHEPELYDLESDADELRNVAGEHPVVCGFLRQLLRLRTQFDIDRGGWIVDTAATELDEDTLEKMRALGYVR